MCSSSKRYVWGSLPGPVNRTQCYQIFLILAVLRRSEQRVCGAHLRVITPRKHSFIRKLLQWWRVVGNTASDLAGRDLNPRPPAPETNAFPLNQLVGPTTRNRSISTNKSCIAAEAMTRILYQQTRDTLYQTSAKEGLILNQSYSFQITFLGCNLTQVSRPKS